MFREPDNVQIQNELSVVVFTLKHLNLWSGLSIGGDKDK